MVDADVILVDGMVDACIPEDDGLTYAYVVLSGSIAGGYADIQDISDGVHLDGDILLLE